MPVVLNDEQRNDLVEMYKTGNFLLKECGKAFNVSYSTAQRIVTKAGCPIRDHRTYTYDDTYFDEIDCEEKAYFFGILFADGHAVDSVPEIKLQLQEADGYMVEKLIRLVSPDKPVAIIKPKYDHWSLMHSITINSPHMKDKLVSYGMIPRKSLVKTFPEVISNSSNEIQKHFLRGYFDGNGGCGLYKVSYDHSKFFPVCYIASTEAMCKSICDVIYKCVDISSTHVRKINRKHDRNSYEVRVNEPLNMIKFLDWLYTDSNWYLVRKFEKYEAIKEYYKNKRS